ncbi:MAG: glycine zipper 2TM domain-containing protein [bacterium]|nr:glycine zipper 2TM domain-containing protein [bacterium]
MILSFLSSCATMQGIIEKPQNSAEREIFIQAIAAGAVIGGVVGGVVGRKTSKKNKDENTAIGAAVGSVIGSGISLLVAKNQIENLRNIELKNDQLKALLNSARQYNREIVRYNHELREQIAQIRKNTKAEQARIAMDKKKQLGKYQIQVKAVIAERTKLSEKLVPGQKRQYQKTLKELETEERKLIITIKELDEIYEQAIIG